MRKETGNVVLLLLIGILLVGALGTYLYLQSSKESQGQKRNIRFAAQEEAISLITLDKATHKWLGLWADDAQTKRNYERIPELDTRYEIPIDELMEYGLLTPSFANRFGGDSVSVYGLSYTSSVIKREIGLGSLRSCISGTDDIDDCQASTGGTCTPYLYATGNCYIEETEEKYSVLTTIGTKGSEIPPEPELICPFISQHEYDSGKGWLVSAPGFNELPLKGSCKTHFTLDGHSNAPYARMFLLQKVNVEDVGIIKWPAGERDEITLRPAPQNDYLICKMYRDRYYNPSRWDQAVAWAAPDIIDSFVECEIERGNVSYSCNTYISYCENDVNQPANAVANNQSGVCTVSMANSEASRLNNPDPFLGWSPYNGYNRDAPWACSVTSGNRIDCSAEYNCSGGPGGTCPAFLNYTKNSVLEIDKDQFATYQRACDQSLVIQATGDVPGAYASRNPPLKWDNGPVCGIGAGGAEIICSGSEDDGSGTGSRKCEVYKYNKKGDNPPGYHDTYYNVNCYGDLP